jgi:hypothetical protein
MHGFKNNSIGIVSSYLPEVWIFVCTSRASRATSSSFSTAQASLDCRRRSYSCCTESESKCVRNHWTNHVGAWEHIPYSKRPLHRTNFCSDTKFAESR